MDTRTFELIKEKIETLKVKQARAEGVISTIQETWKNEFNVTTCEEAEELQKSMDESLKVLEATQSELMDELKSLTSWNAL